MPDLDEGPLPSVEVQSNEVDVAILGPNLCVSGPAAGPTVADAENLEPLAIDDDGLGFLLKSGVAAGDDFDGSGQVASLSQTSCLSGSINTFKNGEVRSPTENNASRRPSLRAVVLFWSGACRGHFLIRAAK